MKDVIDIENRLELLDQELHSMLADIRSRKPKIKLSELSKKVSSRVKDNSDTSELIRKMRDRQ